MHAAVFLDRDDTLIANSAITAHTDHPGDLFDPALVTLLPGVADACSQLKRRGYLLIVVSNQGAVARGRCSLAQVHACNSRMQQLLKQQSGVSLDGIYCCPYHPAGSMPPFNTEHPWRKPAPGMILQAALDHRIDLARSWMIGDAQRDIEAAVAAGIPDAHSILIADPGVRGPRQTFPDMPAAARAIT